jgi:hypothetical protein
VKNIYKLSWFTVGEKTTMNFYGTEYAGVNHPYHREEVKNKEIIHKVDELLGKSDVTEIYVHKRPFKDNKNIIIKHIMEYQGVDWRDLI